LPDGAYCQPLLSAYRIAFYRDYWHGFLPPGDQETGTGLSIHNVVRQQARITEGIEA